MKVNALNTFVCPLSKARLSLLPFEEQKIDLSEQDLERAYELNIDPETISSSVKDGILYCEESRRWYPIINFVPMLLDYPTEIHRDFQARNKFRTDIFDKYEMPDGAPRTGEKSVQKSFTKEWSALPLDQLSFVFTPEQRDHYIRLELCWPEGLLTQPKRKVLEIGCGSGFESMSLDRVTRGEITGIDLNLALLQNGPAIDSKPFINVAIASLFALPLRSKSFDIVYSSGVLHHTYSTKAAFDEIFKFKTEEGFIYIWVYAQEDFAHSTRVRLIWSWEEFFRPILARMPRFLQNAIVKPMTLYNFLIYKTLGVYNKELWGFPNSEHCVRDRWTVPYAHRHSFKEVITWFLEKDLDYRLVDPKAYYDYFKVPLVGIGIAGIPNKF